MATPLPVIQRIYDKFRNGDPLTDKELEVGIEHFDQMAKLLNQSGPVFKLAAQESHRVMDGLASYQRARKQK